MGGVPVTGAEGQNGLFASAVKDGGCIYVKVANTSESAQSLSFNFTGLKKKDPGVKALKRIVFTSDRLYVGLIPGSGRSSGKGNGNPLLYSCLGNPMDRGAQQGTVHGAAQS